MNCNFCLNMCECHFLCEINILYRKENILRQYFLQITQLSKWLLGPNKIVTTDLICFLLSHNHLITTQNNHKQKSQISTKVGSVS